MIENYIWIIFGTISMALLGVYFGKKNAVWGGFTIGIILGFLVALFFVLRGEMFDWYFIGKGAVFGAIIGFATELLGKVSDKMKNRK